MAAKLLVLDPKHPSRLPPPPPTACHLPAPRAPPPPPPNLLPDSGSKTPKFLFFLSGLEHLFFVISPAPPPCRPSSSPQPPHLSPFQPLSAVCRPPLLPPPNLFPNFGSKTSKSFLFSGFGSKPAKIFFWIQNSGRADGYLFFAACHLPPPGRPSSPPQPPPWLRIRSQGGGGGGAAGWERGWKGEMTKKR